MIDGSEDDSKKRKRAQGEPCAEMTPQKPSQATEVQEKESSEKARLSKSQKQGQGMESKTTKELETELGGMFGEDAVEQHPASEGNENGKVEDGQSQLSDNDGTAEDQEQDEKPTDVPSGACEEARTLRSFDDAELVLSDATLYLKSKKGIKRKTTKIPILLECSQGKMLRWRDDQDEPDFVWDVAKSTKVLFEGKTLTSVGDLLKTKDIKGIYNYILDKNKKIKGREKDEDANDPWHYCC